MCRPALFNCYQLLPTGNESVCQRVKTWLPGVLFPLLFHQERTGWIIPDGIQEIPAATRPFVAVLSSQFFPMSGSSLFHQVSAHPPRGRCSCGYWGGFFPLWDSKLHIRSWDVPLKITLKFRFTYMVMVCYGTLKNPTSAYGIMGCFLGHFSIQKPRGS